MGGGRRPPPGPFPGPSRRRGRRAACGAVGRLRSAYCLRPGRPLRCRAAGRGRRPPRLPGFPRTPAVGPGERGEAAAAPRAPGPAAAEGTVALGRPRAGRGAQREGERHRRGAGAGAGAGRASPALPRRVPFCAGAGFCGQASDAGDGGQRRCGGAGTREAAGSEVFGVPVKAVAGTRVTLCWAPGISEVRFMGCVLAWQPRLP